MVISDWAQYIPSIILGILLSMILARTIKLRFNSKTKQLVGKPQPNNQLTAATTSKQRTPELQATSKQVPWPDKHLSAKPSSKQPRPRPQTAQPPPPKPAAPRLKPRGNEIVLDLRYKQDRESGSPAKNGCTALSDGGEYYMHFKPGGWLTIQTAQPVTYTVGNGLKQNSYDHKKNRISFLVTGYQQNDPPVMVSISCEQRHGNTVLHIATKPEA